MPEQIRCPECNATLRVPDSLLGKSVKCPKCQTTFTAETDEPAEAIVEEPPPRPTAARRRPRLEPEEAEDEDAPEEPPEEDEDRPRRRRRRSRRSAEAESMVSGPATALLVVGIIDIVLGVLNLLLPLFGVSLLAMGGAAKKAAQDPDVTVNIVVGAITGIGALILGPLITMGALRMKKLHSYGFAMTACILAMIPCVNCCLLGLPFGIWGMVMLNKPEVKDAFS